MRFLFAPANRYCPLPVTQQRFLYVRIQRTVVQSRSFLADSAYVSVVPFTIKVRNIRSKRTILRFAVPDVYRMPNVRLSVMHKHQVALSPVTHLNTIYNPQL
jgi:hypothetical protein